MLDQVPDRARSHAPPPVRRTSRRGAAALLATALLAVSAGCTSEEPDAAPEPTQSPTPTQGSEATMEPKPVPARVRVTRVAGRLKPKDQEALARNVGKVVSAYFDDAFLGGSYPRSDFANAFRTFSQGAEKQARSAKNLLTNKQLGPTTEAVVPRRQTAYLAVLAPFRVAAGVTARVHLRYLVERGEQTDKVVTVKGRLLLTRKKGGGWKIFGYDLSRSVRTAEEGS